GEHDRELALLDELLDERPPRPRCHVPVDRPHIVPGLILAHLGELDAPPLVRAEVVPREQAVHALPRTQLQPPKLRGEGRPWAAGRARRAGSGHGAGTLDSSRLTMS